MKKTFLFAVAGLMLAACSNTPVDQAGKSIPVPDSVKQDATEPAPAPVITTYKTRSGKIIEVAESHPQGQSLSDIRVMFAGEPSSEMKFTDAEPIGNVLQGDLDGNGFDELYIITTSAGSGSYGNLLGIASNSDKSLSMITFPPVEEKEMQKGGRFEGYEGHDVFEITGKSLVRTFPVKLPKPGKKAVTYTLKAGEASFVLSIQSVKNL